MNGLKLYKRPGTKANKIYNSLCAQLGHHGWPMSKISKVLYLHINGHAQDYAPVCTFCGSTPCLFNGFDRGFSLWCSAQCASRDSSKTSPEKYKMITDAMHKKTRELYDDPDSGFREKIGAKTSQFFKDNPEARKMASVRMKSMIADGALVPNITNTWTHWTIKINGKSFRSSFEGIFHLYMPNAEYETLKIPYNFGGRSRTYIVDFIDKSTNTAYEIKPCSLTDTPINLAKEAALVQWCHCNGFSYETICEDSIMRMANELVDSGVTCEFLTEFRKKYERAMRTYRNR